MFFKSNQSFSVYAWQGPFVEFQFVAHSNISLIDLSVLMVFCPTGIYSFKINKDVVLVPTFSQPIYCSFSISTVPLQTVWYGLAQN